MAKAVRTNLKTAVTKNIAGVKSGGGQEAQHSRSSSPWHSKMHDKADSAIDLSERVLTMNDADFKKFQARLDVLKNTKKEG